MATDPSFIEYVAEQAGLGARLSWKRMFGEYGLYIDDTVVAFACDDSLFVKPTIATAALCAGLPKRPPYPGAKDHPVADEWLDDSERLRGLLLATLAAVPPPKPKRPKAAKKVAAKKAAKKVAAKKVAAKKVAAKKAATSAKKPAAPAKR
ncbi:TfoX/Sxy family protein [Arenimonas composti]|uniref:TfoX N-terminal domain-containing protein n=1 Tax=Arenimonas composti TR7-09 = DSM 18010 TaxID=1121013 RepID=A0A091BCX4_9GAMM|nr:TfoX/Sxy family protein [Arenimonas composti]KFN48684.1 hypothetical protein P873_13585 [Arenimonas composti TR7-09 = DSM 18010]